MAPSARAPPRARHPQAAAQRRRCCRGARNGSQSHRRKSIRQNAPAHRRPDAPSQLGQSCKPRGHRGPDPRDGRHRNHDVDPQPSAKHPHRLRGHRADLRPLSDRPPRRPRGRHHPHKASSCRCAPSRRQLHHAPLGLCAQLAQRLQATAPCRQGNRPCHRGPGEARRGAHAVWRARQQRPLWRRRGAWRPRLQQQQPQQPRSALGPRQLKRCWRTCLCQELFWPVPRASARWNAQSLQECNGQLQGRLVRHGGQAARCHSSRTRERLHGHGARVPRELLDHGCDAEPFPARLCGRSRPHHQQLLPSRACTGARPPPKRVVL
eukprot:comp22274_c0_seq1/m.53108 comp22274_c0_seq1/g.53108  ORF comp22274_c0_seq1/g.53108 comp22274_c0_seq1/m.53108 type:complete len:322 (+) comp22274_c0_seq1:1911-2876(+)